MSPFFFPCQHREAPLVEPFRAVLLWLSALDTEPELDRGCMLSAKPLNVSGRHSYFHRTAQCLARPLGLGVSSGSCTWRFSKTQTTASRSMSVLDSIFSRTSDAVGLLSISLLNPRDRVLSRLSSHIRTMPSVPFVPEPSETWKKAPVCDGPGSGSGVSCCIAGSQDGYRVISMNLHGRQLLSLLRDVIASRDHEDGI